MEGCVLNFELRNTKNKVRSIYKTLYISEELIERINKIAEENGTSFNNVVVSMIEHCLPKKDV